VEDPLPGPWPNWTSPLAQTGPHSHITPLNRNPNPSTRSTPSPDSPGSGSIPSLPSSPPARTRTAARRRRRRSPRRSRPATSPSSVPPRRLHRLHLDIAPDRPDIVGAALLDAPDLVAAVRLPQALPEHALTQLQARCEPLPLPSPSRDPSCPRCACSRSSPRP